MASLYISVLRPPAPAAFPAKSSVTSKRCPASVILPNSSYILIAKAFSRPPKAIPSQKHVYPDPIPEFAAAETQKFKAELLKKLSKEKGIFGDDLLTVVNVCTAILSEFLHQDYGGPGTLLIEPFTDMMVVLKEKDLPGASIAARASLLWAQNYIDQDWEDWNSRSHK